MSQYSRIKIPITQHEKLKSDKKFLKIIQLCRHVNQLNFCRRIEMDAGGGHDPLSTRQRFNAQLFLAACLHEAIPFVDRLHADFKVFKSYKEGFSEFKGDNNVKIVRNQILTRIRTPLAFHILEDPLKETLSKMVLTRWDFAVMDNENDTLHFQFADDVALNYIFPENIKPEEESEHIKWIGKKLLIVAELFRLNANNLIREYIDLKRWKYEPIEIK